MCHFFTYVVDNTKAQRKKVKPQNRDFGVTLHARLDPGAWTVVWRLRYSRVSKVVQLLVRIYLICDCECVQRTYI